jgi:hypothetical protein
MHKVAFIFLFKDFLLNFVPMFVCNILLERHWNYASDKPLFEMSHGTLCVN